jgi:aspartate/glutamate racemase
MRTRRMRGWIIELLKEEGELSTVEIYEIINQITKHGITKNQLGNVLAKTPSIEKKGRINSSRNGERNRSIIWGLKN